MVSGTNGFNYDKVFSYLNSNTQTVRSVTGQTSNGNVSAFVKKMTKEFGAGHPAKPMPVFERYSNEMKEREPDLDTKTISASYKKLKKSQLLELKTKYQFDLEEYKNEVGRGDFQMKLGLHTAQNMQKMRTQMSIKCKKTFTF